MNIKVATCESKAEDVRPRFRDHSHLIELGGLGTAVLRLAGTLESVVGKHACRLRTRRLGSEKRFFPLTWTLKNKYGWLNSHGPNMEAEVRFDSL